MKLYILGKTKDDKGSQLEQLTKRILEYQGYSNIATNVQVSGASELDVTASKTDHTGVNDIVTPVICECKAHEKPITMTDWLKFIGKLYIARKTEPRTIGLMLALSGANGAVIGSATADFKDDPSVQLIANDDIIALISKVYGLPDQTAIKGQLSQLPIPSVIEVNPVYYNSHIWWLVGCNDNHFTLCHSDSTPAKYDEVKEILPMLPVVTEYQEDSFIDIWNSMEIGSQLRQIEKFLVVELLKKNNIAITETRQLFKGVDEHVLSSAISNSLFITIDNDNCLLKLCDFTNVSLVDFYRFLLDGDCPVEAFTTSFYQNHINGDLLEQIWKIQCDFKLPAELHEKCILLLRLSPLALKYSLLPDSFLFGFSKMNDNEDMKNLYYNHYMGTLQDFFIADFRNPSLNSLYLDTYGIEKVTISTCTSINVKNKLPVVINAEQNFALVKLKGADQAVMIVSKKDI